MTRFNIILFRVALLCFVLGAGLGLRASERALAAPLVRPPAGTRSQAAPTAVLRAGSPLPAGTRSQAAPTAVLRAGSPLPADLHGFHLLNPGDGWLWVGERIFWTHDAGRNWVNITPPNFERAAIRSVFFSDVRHGWLVGLRPNSAGVPAWVLARSPDGGRSWQITSLSLFAPDEAEIMSGPVTLDFLDAQNGWLVVQRTTSSAFSAGALFQTTDSGQNWVRSSLPGGNPVYFATPTLGWTTGGPGGDQLYRSTDGGRTWLRQFVGGETAIAGRRLHYRLPRFDNPHDGVLPVIVSDGSDIRVHYYVADDGGDVWQSAVSVPVGAAGGMHVALSVLNSRRWLQASSTGDRMLDVTNRQEINTRLNTDGRAAGIVELDMVTPEIGWAETHRGDCERNAAGQTRCAQQAGLLRTTDGGLTWQAVDVPAGQGAQSPQNPAQAQFVAGQGFDACYPGSAVEMQTWFDSSPYRVVNLYIGGSSLYSGCTPLTPSLVNELAQQGWTFVPAWVGPQAPCTNYSTRFAYDTTLAQNQGIDEANAAIERAAALGLTQPDKSATIIYYDMEYFDTGNAACRDAAKAFVSGWAGQLRTRANKAGVYAINTVLSDYSAITNVPDDIWIAQQGYSTYTSTASVWGVPYITDMLWVNHQRLHQYTGGHDETWGGVTLNVDSDVLDARVVALPCYTLSVGVSGPGDGAASIQSPPNCGSGYFANSSVQLQGIPGAGFLFTGWTGDAAEQSNPLALYVDGNKNLVANFAAIQSRIFIPLVQRAPP
jgi:uncharacterized repeat protein (TIGR02543 family)